MEKFQYRVQEPNLVHFATQSATLIPDLSTWLKQREPIAAICEMVSPTTVKASHVVWDKPL